MFGHGRGHGDLLLAWGTQHRVEVPGAGVLDRRRVQLDEINLRISAV
jgi:hypothetical protein